MEPINNEELNNTEATVPPADNEHVAEGAEQFQEGDSSVAPETVEEALEGSDTAPGEVAEATEGEDGEEVA